MEFRIVFIDDNLSVEEPFVRAIAKKFPKADTSHVFVNPQEGLSFVLNHLDQKTIVFIDSKFDGYEMQGINILKKIREKTSLVYIVMMSANGIMQGKPDDIISMINEDFIYYLDRSSNNFHDASCLIERIQKLWTTRFDCILEQWLLRHKSDADKLAITKADKSYTWRMLLDEVRQQTDVGKYFEKILNQYYIYNLNENHK